MYTNILCSHTVGLVLDEIIVLYLDQFRLMKQKTLTLREINLFSCFKLTEIYLLNLLQLSCTNL